MTVNADLKQRAESIRQTIADSPDPAVTAYQCARLGLLAMMFYRGPKTTAEEAYRLADEMADAAAKFGGGQ